MSDTWAKDNLSTIVDLDDRGVSVTPYTVLALRATLHAAPTPATDVEIAAFAGSVLSDMDSDDDDIVAAFASGFTDIDSLSAFASALDTLCTDLCQDDDDEDED